MKNDPKCNKQKKKISLNYYITEVYYYYYYYYHLKVSIIPNFLFLFASEYYIDVQKKQQKVDYNYNIKNTLTRNR